jgi:hypothetical protein
MPGYEYRDTSTDDVEPDLLLLESPLEALELQITSADLHLKITSDNEAALLLDLIFELRLGLGVELCGLYRQLPCGLFQLITVFTPCLCTSNLTNLSLGSCLS